MLYTDSTETYGKHLPITWDGSLFSETLFSAFGALAKDQPEKEKENPMLAKFNPILQEYDRRWKNKKHDEITAAMRGIEGEDAAVAAVKESLDSFNMFLDANGYPEVVTLNLEHLYGDETRAKMNQENHLACKFLTAHEEFMKETRLMLDAATDEEHAWEILRWRGICNEAFIFAENMYDPTYKAPFLFGKRTKTSDDPINYDPKGGK